MSRVTSTASTTSSSTASPVPGASGAPATPYGLREYRAVVGTGLPTIGSVAFHTAEKTVGVGFASGDGTVPGRSAAQGPIGGKDPLGDNIPISYVCGIEHVALDADKGVPSTFGDYIRYGRPPKKTEPCDMSGTAFELYSLSTSPSASSARRRRRPHHRGVPKPTLKALDKALATPGVDVLSLPGNTLVVTSAAQPRTLTLSAHRLFVTVRALRASRTGKAQTFGP